MNETFPLPDYTCITEADFLTTWKAALSPSGNPDRWSEAAGLPDVYFAHLNPNLMYQTWPYLGFFRGAARWPASGAAAYAAITRADVAAMADQGLLLEQQLQNYTCYVNYNALLFEVGDSFVFLTSEGRLAKLTATARPYYAVWVHEQRLLHQLRGPPPLRLPGLRRRLPAALIAICRAREPGAQIAMWPSASKTRSLAVRTSMIDLAQPASPAGRDQAET